MHPNRCAASVEQLSSLQHRTVDEYRAHRKHLRPQTKATLSRLGLVIAAIALTLACNDLTESVSTDVCLSGLRWIGKATRDPEMYPGRDCVGCHLENDGPPFLAAGTIYATVDNAREIRNDCFGLEGVEVEVEGADGEVFKATTNRAGNFYFDGQPSWLAKPYVARLRYTKPDGRVAAPQMIATAPSYGGCARCHDSRAATTPELDVSDPQFVRPEVGLFVQ